jgi:DNA gyrase subunit B
MSKKNDSVRTRTIKDDREWFRKKATNYIPNTFKEGGVHLLYEIVDNGIDEGMNSKTKGKNITIWFNEKTKWYRIKDDGRGINPSDLVSAFTVKQTSGKYDNADGKGGYKWTGGTNGLGAKLNYFLSKAGRMSTTQKFKTYTIRSEDGRLLSEEPVVTKADYESGVDAEFLLDPKLIDTSEITFEDIFVILNEKSHIFPEISFRLIKIDEHGKEHKPKLLRGRNMKDFVESMGVDLPVISADRVTKHVSYIDRKLKLATEGEAEVSFAISMKEDLIDSKELAPNFNISYGNSIKTKTGGSHVLGLQEGIIKFFKKELMSSKIKVTTADINKALCSFIAVNVVEPEFRGQFKDSLYSEVARLAMMEVVEETLEQQPKKVIKDYCEMIKDVARSREASKKSREKRKISLSAFSDDAVEKHIPIMLTDETYCRELYVVEGDSVMGSITKSRNIYNQGVFPLSKPNNTIDKEYGDLEKIASSFNDFCKVIGWDLGKKNIKRSDLHYDKIFLTLDKDIDGDAMAGDMSALMYKFTPKLFEWGMVYRLVPPLYTFKSKKGNDKFINSQKELYQYVVDDYMVKNELHFKNNIFSKKDIVRFYNGNFGYAKELDNLCSAINGKPKVVELIVSRYSVGCSYSKKDIPTFQKLLKDFPDLSIEFKKGTIQIKGEDNNGDNIYISLNRLFDSKCRVFKEIQSKNLFISKFKINGEDSTIYDVIRSIDKCMPSGIHRIKGLGEMSSRQFTATCMDPEKRHVIRMELPKDRDAGLERVYIYYSGKKRYVELRKQVLKELIYDSQIIDT